MSGTTAPPRPRSPLARAGAAMAVGTVASRGTGFLRTAVIAWAVGVNGVGDAYNVANTVPNILYDLLLGGVLSSVMVPLLVSAARESDDDGEAYAQRLVTMVVATLAVVAVVAVLLAPVIVTVYASQLDHAQRTLAVTFARFFLPQLLFYGVGATYGAILNIRGSFGAPMWAPVLNNLVVIASGVLFVGVTHHGLRAGDLSHTQTMVLAVGTTAGVVAQTVALLPALRRSGFRNRLRWDWRGTGLSRTGSFAGWIVGYVVTNQLGYVVVVRLAIGAGRTSGFHSGFSPYTYAFALFQLPYAVIAVTVITALFPRMSRSAAEGDEPAVAGTLADGLSLSAVVLMPATALLLVLGPSVAAVVFSHGHTSAGAARLIGLTLGGFAVGLVPFSAFQMQLRAWLAVRDSRTPALVNVVATAVNVLADVVLYLVLPDRDKIVGLAVGFALSYLVGCVGFTLLLRRRLRPRTRTHVIRTHVRTAVAAAVCAVPAYAVSRLLSHALGGGPAADLVVVGVAAVVGAVTFVTVARRMRVRELEGLLRALPLGARLAR